MSAPQQGKIYAKICAVMKAVDSIGKGRKNQSQGYAFRGIDDVYNAMHGPLSEQGVFIVPIVLEQSQKEQPSKSGGVLFYTTLKVAHRFYCEDGSYVEAITCGEAMDSGDKSTNKAMSAAMKYAILEVFAIPTEGDNDTENHSHEAAGRATARNTAPTHKSAPELPKAQPAPDGAGSRTVVECPQNLKKFPGKAGAKYKFMWVFPSVQAGMQFKTFSDTIGPQLEAAMKAGTELAITYDEGEYNGKPEGKVVGVDPV